MATLARSHDHLSNRAKARSLLEHKPVYKSVLDNPFQINWPSVPPNLQNIILARLVTTLENVRASVQDADKQDNEEATSVYIQSSAQADQASADASPPLVIGINVVTRALEFQLGASRKRISTNSDQLPPPPQVVAVFVCRADMDPSALVEHIPYLVAGCNSLKNVTRLIKLVPLPKGSEPTIAKILGVRRAAVVACRHGSRLSEALQDVMDSIPVISAPWLCPIDAQGPEFVPTHIKQLRTTAPKDMKSARAQRSKARAEAKKKVSSSSRSVRRKARVVLKTDRSPRGSVERHGGSHAVASS